MTKTVFRGCCALLIVSATTATALAQTVTFLTPAQFSARAGETVAVDVRVRAREELRAAPWPTGQVEWFFVRTVDTQRNVPDARPLRKLDGFVTVALNRPGLTVIGLDHKPRVERMRLADARRFFNRYVSEAHGAQLESGLKDVRDANPFVRIRRIESSKTMLRVSDADDNEGSNAPATSKTGQKVEIRALLDPTRVPAGSDLPVRVYVEGSGADGVQVRAVHVESGAEQTVTSDGKGFANLRIHATGTWRIEFHQARFALLKEKADWTVSSATLTFDNRGKGAPE